MPDVWKQTPQTISFGGTDDKYAPKGQYFPLAPRLALIRLEKDPKAPNFNWSPRPSDGKTPEQYIWFDDNTSSFKWLPGKPTHNVAGLQFHRFNPPPRDPSKDKSKNFNDTFAGKSSIAQMTHPFYGYNPKAAGFGSREANIWSGLLSAGTGPLDYTKSNPHQSLPHALLFEYPKPDSYNYDVGVGIGDNPALPYGVTFEQFEACSDNAYTEELTSISDTVRSWSVTCGFNAGIQGMLSGGLSAGFSEQTKNQLERQSRYTISRAVDVKFVVGQNVPALKLEQQFVTELESRLIEILAGFDEPDWENFIATFGTHYVYTMTLGSIHCALTRYSLAAEVRQRTAGVNISASASAATSAAKDASKGGGNFDIKNELEQKLGVTIDFNDVQSYKIGFDKEPVAIFYDLRPITELLSPIFSLQSSR